MVAEGQSPLGQERHGNRLGSMTARTRVCSQNCHPHTARRKNKKKNRKWNATLKSQAHLDTSILMPLPPKMFPNSLPNGNQVSKSTPNKFTGPQTLMAMSKSKKSVFSPISKHSNLSILHCPEVSKYLLRLNATF